MNPSSLVAKRLAFITDCVAEIASEENLGEPTENRQAFDRLAAAGWITPTTRDLCRRMVSFRNIVVHGYLRVDPLIVQRIVERNLDDLLAFVRAIRETRCQRASSAVGPVAARMRWKQMVVSNDTTVCSRAKSSSSGTAGRSSSTNRKSGTNGPRGRATPSRWRGPAPAAADLRSNPRACSGSPKVNLKSASCGVALSASPVARAGVAVTYYLALRRRRRRALARSGRGGSSGRGLRGWRG